MDVLTQILEKRKKSVQTAKERVPMRELERAARDVIRPIPFSAAINQPGKISVIAEMKKKSPSAGVIRPDYNVAVAARAYEKGGATALSVLTEPDFFEGNIADIPKVRQVSTLPILRKDFIFDPYQIVEARVRRADAVLLIAEMLAASQMRELVMCALAFGVETLVEIYSAKSLPAALATGASMIGINARDLRTLEMHPEHIATLAREVPKDRIVVAESGLKTPADIERLKALPVGAVLVGESLLKRFDMEAAVRELVNASYRK